MFVKMDQCSLYVFIDRSVDTYALIVVEERNLPSLRRGLKWVVHFKKLSRREEKSFLGAFRRRFRKVMRYLTYSRLMYSPGEIHRFLSSLNLVKYTIYCDDSLSKWLKRKGYRVIPESRTPSNLRSLMLLVDNLANYSRIMHKKGKLEKIRELVK